MRIKKSLLALGLFSTLGLGAQASEFNPRAFGVECVLRGTCVEVEGVMDHLRSLQTIADENNKNRSAASLGHVMSANYIGQKLLAAGYKVELQPFSFMQFTKVSAALTQSSPANIVYEEEKDYSVMSYSGSGSAQGPVVGVDLDLGEGNKSTSGCEPEDFKSFPQGAIALVQRGACAFQVKAENAQAAGASAVIIFNQGDSEGKKELFNGTLSNEALVDVPVFATSYDFAVELLDLEGLTLQMQAETLREEKASYNVIAETAGGDADNVVMIGAHLDSVAEGPGINDNGSGSAAILEVALAMKDTKVKNKVRFGWFSAEELGLIGSRKYVESLSQAQIDDIALYINVDMVGSPNYMLSVFDGDGSKFGQKGPKGSDVIERKFHEFFKDIGLASVESELNGRSDYAAFSAAGVAVGGVFTGAEGVKTEEEAALFGGVAGEAYDKCYHKACDDIANINQDALKANTEAIAFMLLSFGDSVDEIRSVEKSKSSTYKNKVVFPKHLHCHDDVFEM